MLKKLLRLVFALLGGFFGYGIYALSAFLLPKMGVNVNDYLSPQLQVVVPLLLGIIFAIIFFRMVPAMYSQSRKAAESIGNELQGVSGIDILSTVVGLIVGLVIAFLLAQIYTGITNTFIKLALTIATYLVMGFLGVVISNKKGKEIVTQVLNRASKDSSQEQGSPATQTRFSVGGGKKKQANQVPKILDTSVIIDGRIAEIMKTGFLEGPIVIPEFVLVELRHIADSSDSLKRARGRRGLDILNKIQNDYGIEIYNTDSEKALKDIHEVDVKLLKLAQIMNGKVVTNDFNLNKVAGINGVGVLNINELANTLKPVVIPGEKMTITPVKEGKDSHQSIAYLDDGTMVVVEDGREEIGKECEITVTSVIQTSAGRMIFGRIHI